MLTAHRLARIGLALAGAAACATGLLACSGSGVSDYAQAYPERKRVAPTLDIQVVRESTHVRLTNSTARSFPRCNLWLNQWYVRPIKGLAVGESLHLPLSEFVDVHSEAYRGGGFFATRAPDRLVSAHLELEDEMLPLVVAYIRED